MHWFPRLDRPVGYEGAVHRREQQSRAARLSRASSDGLGSLSPVDDEGEENEWQDIRGSWVWFAAPPFLPIFILGAQTRTLSVGLGLEGGRSRFGGGWRLVSWEVGQWCFMIWVLLGLS